MKLNLDQVITIGNQTMASELGKPLRLADAVFSALNVSPQQVDPRAQPLNYSDACKRGLLAIKVQDAGEQEIDEEMVSVIKSNLPVLYTPVAVAIIGRMLKD